MVVPRLISWLIVPSGAYNQLWFMKPFTTKILRYESLSSTNSEAARLAGLGAEEGLVVVADEQTAGRGRLQRKWISPKGAGLYSSILLHPEIPQESWSLITFVAALAVNDALFEACSLQTDIKWPNDLLASERKICGILAEVVETSKGRGIVLGIGINLTNEAFPEELRSHAISVMEAIGSSPEREAILSSLLKALARWYALLHEDGSSERILAEWTRRSSYAEGKLVRIVNGDETITGVTRGLETDGGLRLETETRLLTIRAGDVVSLRAGE